MDLTHTKIDLQGLSLLHKVAEEQKVVEKIRAMIDGELINNTEKRKVWHVKLRPREDESEVAQTVLKT